MYCGCGCGEITPVAKRNDARWGHVRGHHTPYAVGHNARSRARYEIDEETGCWEWVGTLTTGGYGHRWDPRQRRLRVAHAMSWEAVHGVIPEGLDLDHLCRNRRCVNPAHLEPVTRSENIRRGAAAKLTLDDAREIKASGAPLRDLSERFGVSMSMASRIRRGRVWRDA